MKVSLADILPRAAEGYYSVAGCNVFSIPWASAIIRAAESLQKPVIIMTNRSMVSQTPPRVCGPALSALAEQASVPVCVHLDHCNDRDIICEAIDNGYSSVMYDGSHDPLDHNIARTIEIQSLAHSHGVSIEAEIGTVRYHDNPSSDSQYTEHEEVAQFIQETNVDALAISIGTIHRLTSIGAKIQYERLQQIESVCEVPLVIHGTSGISQEDIITLKSHRIAKFNIGTVFRQVFASTLRETMANDPTLFDSIELMTPSYEAVQREAERMIMLLS